MKIDHVLYCLIDPDQEHMTLCGLQRCWLDEAHKARVLRTFPPGAKEAQQACSRCSFREEARL